MSDKALKNRIRQQLASERLSDEQHQRLQALIARHQPEEPAGKAPRPDGGLSRRGFLAGMATAAGVAGLGLGAWQLRSPATITHEMLTAEVLRNHLFLKPLDLQTQAFDQLARYFTGGLDFVLVHSQVFPHEELVLEGGRYCSLGGIKAAQILFRDPGNRVVSFYQTRYDPERVGPMPRVDNNEAPVTVRRDQHRVRLWVERGILMASAQSEQNA